MELHDYLISESGGTYTHILVPGRGVFIYRSDGVHFQDTLKLKGEEPYIEKNYIGSINIKDELVERAISAAETLKKSREKFKNVYEPINERLIKKFHTD